jgi:hypothetical protein
MKTFRTLAPVALSAALIAAAPASAANTGAGTFRLDKTKSTFNSVCAYRIPNPQAPGSTQVAVILASKPLDCAAHDRGFTPVESAEEALNALEAANATLTIAPGGDRADGSWRSRQPSDSFSFGGQGDLKITKNTDSRIEGRYSTATPQSFFDKTFEFDLKFAAEVLGGAVQGTPLPAGGGDPGKVFQALIKALGKKDMAAAQKLALADYASMLEYRRDSEFQKATVSGGLVKGASAALDVEGTSFGGDKLRGRVFLEQEAGAWKVRSKQTTFVFD